MLYPTELCKLIEYDKEKSTEYVWTLKVYIDNNFRQSKTAEALYIQRSTLLYRLQKIEEITGLDTDDLDMKVRLLIAFKLMEIQRDKIV